VFAIALSLFQLRSADTIAVSRLEESPSPSIAIDSTVLGPPQVRIPTRARPALVWLLRAGDTVFVAASLSDTSQYWGDDFVISLDTRGDGAADPQHDDFQLYFRRTIDSSVVYPGAERPLATASGRSRLAARIGSLWRWVGGQCAKSLEWMDPAPATRPRVVRRRGRCSAQNSISGL
jgi:hypothetical protein